MTPSSSPSVALLKENFALPCSTASTCSNRSSASPIPCVELNSLPVPRGRGREAPSPVCSSCGRMSDSGGTEGMSWGSVSRLDSLEQSRMNTGAQCGQREPRTRYLVYAGPQEGSSFGVGPYDMSELSAPGQHNILFGSPLSKVCLSARQARTIPREKLTSSHDIHI